MIKKVLKILAGFIAVFGLAWVIYVVTSKHEEVNCSGLIININYPEYDVFIEKNEVEEIVMGVYQNLYATKISEINTENLENLILKNPYVRTADVYATIQGEIIINIGQRQPIFRLEMAKGSFYVDNFGSFMPLSPLYVSRLVVVNGHLKNIDLNKQEGINFENGSENSELVPIFRLVKFIKKDVFLSALVEQIYINKNKEIELTPKIGRQSILFGSTDNMEEKFRNLRLFYSQGMKINGWDAYRVINVKYKNQVVCTKI